MAVGVGHYFVGWRTIYCICWRILERVWKDDRCPSLWPWPNDGRKSKGPNCGSKDDRALVEGWLGVGRRMTGRWPKDNGTLVEGWDVRRQWVWNTSTAYLQLQRQDVNRRKLMNLWLKNIVLYHPIRLLLGDVTDTSSWPTVSWWSHRAAFILLQSIYYNRSHSNVMIINIKAIGRIRKNYGVY